MAQKLNFLSHKKMQIFFSFCAVLCLYNIYFFITLLEAISETERCVCIVSSWSRHQSNSSSVSTAVRMEDSSEDISVVLFISLLCYNYILGWVLFGKSWSRSKVNSFLSTMSWDRQYLLSCKVTSTVFTTSLMTK